MLYAATIVVTGAYNVPRNDNLAALDPSQPGAVAVWNDFLREWTGANHVRTATSLAAAITWTLALRRRRAAQ